MIMFKKIIFALLIASSIVCFHGCSKKENKAEEAVKNEQTKKDDIDLSSKEATYRNFVTALNGNDFDKAWKCLPPETQKKGEQIAQDEKKSLYEFQKDRLDSIRTGLLDVLKSQYNNDLEKFINDSLKECSDGDFVNVDGKWYIVL